MRLPWRKTEERERDELETQLVIRRAERVIEDLRQTLNEAEKRIKKETEDGRL